MQTLQAQLATMGKVPTQTMKGANSFYDLVAADSVSSYKMSKIFQVYNDKQTVSIAGDTVQPLSGLTISLNLSDVLLHAHDSGLAFEIEYTNGYCPAAHKLFMPTSMQLGSLDIQIQNGKYYTSQLLSTMDKEAIHDYKMGLGLSTDIDTVYGGTGRELDIAIADNAIAPVADYAGISSYVRSLWGQHLRHCQTAPNSAAADVTETHKQVCFIPLHILMPALADLPGVYLGLGQKLTINGSFVGAGECMLHNPIKNAVADQGAPFTYVIRNAHLLACYSVLDGPRRDAILTQNVSPIPIVRNVTLLQGGTINGAYQMPISRGQYVRRVLLSLHPKNLSTAVDAGAGSSYGIGNVYTNVAAKYKCPLMYHPNFLLDFMQIQVGAQTYTFRQQQLKFLQLPSFGAQSPYESPVIKNLRYVLEIDLSRFGDMTDAAGALGNEQNQITINWQVADGQAFPGVENLTQARLDNFQWAITCEFVSFAQCANGIYGMI